MFKTTNGGRLWLRASTSDAMRSVEGLTVDPGSPDTVYALADYDVYATTDAGSTWAPLDGFRQDSARVFLVDPSISTTLYAGNARGVLKSTDAGTSWEALGRGMHENDVPKIAVHPFDPDTLYAGTFLGLVKSTDAGRAWTRIDGGHGAVSGTGSLVVDPKTPDTVYATGRQGLYMTTDGGVRWNLINGFIADIVVDPENPKTMYVPGDEVYKSTDGGVSWTKSSHFGDEWSEVSGLAIDPRDPATLYAGNTRHPGLWRTNDAGNTWKWIPDVGWTGYFYQWVIACDPNRSGTVYAASNSRVIWKSVDHGQTWASIVPPGELPPPRVISLFLPPGKAGTVYAGVEYGTGRGSEYGIYLSTNGGRTWKPINRGLKRGEDVNMFACSPAAPNKVYAATGGGVYRKVGSQ